MFFQSKSSYVIVSIFIGILLGGVQPVAADEEEFNQIVIQARAGEADAQYQLAEQYYRGDGLTRNYEIARTWYEKAANQGHADAQYQMGYFYQHGLDKLEKNDEQAFAWFHKAALSGHTSAQTQLAIMYSQGVGVEQDKELSRQWSSRVLEKKGLFNTRSGKSDAIQKSAPEPAAKVESRPEAIQSSPVVEQQAQPAKSNKTSSTAELSAEELKAWRYKKARQLVEEANRKAAAIGEWAEED